MLQVKNLHVNIGDKEVLKGVNLHIADGETFILFGPNGSGKTTLLMTLMGFGNYTITQGSITFKGVDITHAPSYERARLGIGMSFQRPPTIHGLKTRHLVEMCSKHGGNGEAGRRRPGAQRVNFERLPGPRHQRGLLGRRDQAFGAVAAHVPGPEIWCSSTSPSRAWTWRT